MTCIAVARSIVYAGALVGILVTCQSFIPALDEDVCLKPQSTGLLYPEIIENNIQISEMIENNRKNNRKIIGHIEIIGKIIGKIIVIIGQIIGNNRL